MDGKQAEFIYSTHLWTGNVMTKKTSAPQPTKTTKQVQKPKIENRKWSDHEWDHEDVGIHQFGIRKMS